MRITGLRAVARGRVAVELDGVPWRTLPPEAVARAGLTEGEVTREQLRTLARELRRSRALRSATRSLQTRDLSVRALDDRLARAGHGRAAREEAITAVARAGFVDDERLAHARAAALVRRGYGDAAIRADLERRGVDTALAAAAVAAIEPEAERAQRIVAERGRGASTCRLLVRRGFDPEQAAVAAGVEDP